MFETIDAVKQFPREQMERPVEKAKQTQHPAESDQV
jgi:hypothetical protein